MMTLVAVTYATRMLRQIYVNLHDSSFACKQQTWRRWHQGGMVQVREMRHVKLLLHDRCWLCYCMIDNVLDL